MRLRNIPGAKEEMLVNPFVVQSPEEYKGRWNEFFGNDNPLYIEVGCGKGQFIVEHARRNPNINYIGIEKYSSVLLRALQKRAEEDLPNLFFLRFDAEGVNDVFDKDEVSRIYLNFSDPWPKDRNAKRRLTSSRYMARYNDLLIPDGQVEFKTDNRDLFDWSLEEIEAAGWKLSDVTFDLHHSEFAEGNIMTEYEERFSAMGNPICRLVAKR